MSNTASNYNVERLEIGISLGALALTASLANYATNLFKGNMAASGALIMASLHCSMMFASSYVEEEHHFWYWASSGWLMWLFSKQ